MEPEAYYRRRIAHFDDERDIFTHYTSLVTPSEMEAHMLRWECSQQEEDIKCLQSEIAQVQYSVKLAAMEQSAKEQELAELHHTRAGRQHRIQRLLAICQPAQRDRTVVLDAKWPNSQGVWSNDIKYTQRAPGTVTDDTLHLNHTLTELADKIEHRRQQLLLELQKMENYYNGTEQATSLKIQALSHETQKFIDRLSNVENQHFDTVKDLLRLRLQVQVAQRVDVDLKEHCKQAMIKFETEQANVIHQYNSESAALKQKTATDAQDTVEELQQQLAGFVQQAADMKATTKSTLVKYEEKIARASEQLQTVRDRYKRLYHRHELEIQGYAAETRLIHNRMRQIKRFNNL